MKLPTQFILLLFSFLCLPDGLYSQSIIDQNPDWSKLEISLSYGVRDSLISLIDWEYSPEMVEDLGESIFEKPPNGFHFLFINDDALVDIIYTGPLPGAGEGGEVSVFIKVSTCSARLFNAQGELISQLFMTRFFPKGKQHVECKIDHFLPSGLYFLKLNVDKKSHSQKVLFFI